MIVLRTASRNPVWWRCQHIDVSSAELEASSLEKFLDGHALCTCLGQKSGKFPAIRSHIDPRLAKVKIGHYGMYTAEVVGVRVRDGHSIPALNAARPR